VVLRNESAIGYTEKLLQDFKSDTELFLISRTNGSRLPLQIEAKFGVNNFFKEMIVQDKIEKGGFFN
jgi:hypothetical protein